MKKAILIADDDAADLRTAQRVLKKAKVLNEVRTVQDGAAVIAYLNGEGIYADRERYPYPDILLLDLKLPKKSGMEVLEWIRSRPEHRGVGIIVLAEIGNLDEIRRAYQLGAHSFLIKPIRVEDFSNLLAALRGVRLQVEGKGHILAFDKPSAH